MTRFTYKVGFIGLGKMNGGHLGGFLGRDDVKVLAVAEVHKFRRDEAKGKVDKKYGTSDCAAYNDFRELLARPDIDAVFTCGPRMKALHGALPLAKRGAWGASLEELYPALEAYIEPQDIVLLKGSNSMKLSRIMHLFSQKRDARLGSTPFNASTRA
jgi:hypothetical protein